MFLLSRVAASAFLSAVGIDIIAAPNRWEISGLFKQRLSNQPLPGPDSAVSGLLGNGALAIERKARVASPMQRWLIGQMHRLQLLSDRYQLYSTDVCVFMLICVCLSVTFCCSIVWPSLYLCELV